MSSTVVKSLSRKLELLRAAVRTDDVVLVTGFPSTGKTTLAKKVLDEHPEYMYVYINCNNIASTSMLYLQILKLLHHKLNINDDSKRMLIKSTITAQDFTDKYNKLHRKAAKTFNRVYLILDQIELLKKTAMMDAIVFLTSGIKMSFMFISGENGIDFTDGFNSVNYRPKFIDRLSIIELNAWSREDLIESILEQPPSESKELYEKFVHNVVSSVYSSNTKDFVELRSFCQENFGSFLQLYRNKTNELLKKEKLIDDDINLDDVDFDDFDQVSPSILPCVSAYLNTFKDLIKTGEVRDWGFMRVDRKVVLHTAALIIASYVAAYTRPSDDKKNFIRFQKRMSKRMKMDHSDINPKAFTMERLIQIYRGIIILMFGLPEDSSILRQDSVLSDIQLLEDLDLISVVVGDGLNSQTRYKISHHVSRDYVNALSQSIEFDLNNLTGVPMISK